MDRTPTIPSPIDIHEWPQAVVAVVLILAVLVMPGLLVYLNNRISRQARTAATEAKDKAEAVHDTLTTNNGGSHVKDQLDRLEKMMIGLGDTLAAHLDSSAEQAGLLEDRLEALETSRTSHKRLTTKPDQTARKKAPKA